MLVDGKVSRGLDAEECRGGISGLPLLWRMRVIGFPLALPTVEAAGCKSLRWQRAAGWTSPRVTRLEQRVEDDAFGE